MMGPTGGYLVGYLLAAPLCGWLAERWDRCFFTTALAMLAGNAVIYAPGLLWPGSMIGWDKPVLKFGLIPLMPRRPSISARWAIGRHIGGALKC